MKKITLLFLLASIEAFSQTGNVGINTSSPQATLDIRGKNDTGFSGVSIPGTVNANDGLLVPRVSSLSNNGNVNGQLVYLVADAGSFTKGFHYWNGSTWTLIGDKNTGSASIILNGTSFERAALTGDITAAANVNTTTISNNAVNSAKIADGAITNTDLNTGVGGIYKGSGTLSGNTTVTQGANTLGFTSTATNGFSVNGNTFSVDAANNKVGIGTTTPNAKLEINSGTNGVSGLKFTNLNSTSTASSTVTKNLSVDASGNVILARPLPPIASDLSLFGSKITFTRQNISAWAPFFTTVVFPEGEEVDSANAFDFNSGVFIAPSAGYYFFIGSVQFDNTVIGGNFSDMGIRIIKNNLSGIAQQFTSMITTLHSLSVSGTTYLNQNDTIVLATTATRTTPGLYSIVAASFSGWKISN